MSNSMMFPETFDEFVEIFGFVDSKEYYTNGSELIPVFRVKQWLENENSRQKAEISVLRKLLDKAETEMNNQSENIKKLTADCYSMQSTLAKMSMGVEQAKAEAIKEFAERLKPMLGFGKYTSYEDIDNLVKEMVGD